MSEMFKLTPLFRFFQTESNSVRTAELPNFFIFSTISMSEIVWNFENMKELLVNKDKFLQT